MEQVPEDSMPTGKKLVSIIRSYLCYKCWFVRVSVKACGPGAAMEGAGGEIFASEG